MLALLALASSACWGTADFFAGLRSRTLPAAVVVAWSQAIALVTLTFVLLVRGQGLGDLGWVPWSAGAGLSGMTGLLLYYRALSSGTMGVVAPVASLGVVVPVVLGVLGGDQPKPTAWAGMVVAVVGVVLASGPELSGDASPRPVVLASVAAVGFGLALFCLDRGARVSLLETLWGMRLTSVACFALAGLVLRTRGRVGARDAVALGAIGLGDLTANALFAFASSRGLVSVASVLGSVYPVFTILLARQLLHERLRRVQVLGVVLSVLGVAVIAA